MTKLIFHALRRVFRAVAALVASIEFVPVDGPVGPSGLLDAAGLPTTSAAEGVFLGRGF